MATSLQGKRAVVMGLGRFGGGVGVTRFLVAQGADVLVTDQASSDELAASVRQLDDLPDGAVDLRLGEHNVSDFTTCDLVVVNPAVKPDNRFIRAAAAANIPVTSEIRLLIERLPNRRRSIGVTGSAGKSTVTAMIGHVLGKAARAWVGGNIGGSLLPTLSEIGDEDRVVLELSSFMLRGIREDRWSPHIAVVTNITPNHLDWHADFDDYVASKATIAAFQQPGDVLIRGNAVPVEAADGVDTPTLLTVEEVRDSLGDGFLLPGRHNLDNARLAVAACVAAGVDAQRACELLGDFTGLPHRLQFVCENAGITFYNDSKSTTPEAAALAIDAFAGRPIHLILGGHDKGSDLTGLAGHAAVCKGVYTIGATGDAIADAAAAGSAEVVRCGTLDRAVEQAVMRAARGDVVLLSPGCASWDQFTNFEQRGSAFVEAVLRYNTERQHG